MTQSYARPVDMGQNVFMIDLYEQGQPCRTAGYLIMDKQLTLVETGSARSHEALLSGLFALGLTPQDLRYVIVTHVHLDHAGGAGQLMEKATNATLVVHPRGAKHMIDPSKLWSGAAQVYGDLLSPLFGSVVPVPSSRVLIKDHEETLNIGERTLTFYDSPGHAKHHFTIFDPAASVLYAGDALGIHYQKCFTGFDFEWLLPSTSPVDFDPEAIHHTANMLKKVPFQWVYHGHFGKSGKEEAIEATERGGDAMAKWIEEAYEPGMSESQLFALFRAWLTEYLAQQGYKVPSDLSALQGDIMLDSMGLLFYEERRRRSLSK